MDESTTGYSIDLTPDESESGLNGTITLIVETSDAFPDMDPGVIVLAIRQAVMGLPGVSDAHAYRSYVGREDITPPEEPTNASD